MGKKKFIDKKKSATFTLVFRDTSAEDDAAVPIRQFTRVDGGNSYVPGFSEDDPKSQPGGDEYSDEEEDDYEDEEEEEEGVNDGQDSDSRFEDADESEDGDEEEVVQAKPMVPKAAVGKKAVPRSKNGLSESVRRELIELGFPDDGYDYNKHMRSIASTGAGAAFVPSTRAADPLLADIRAYDASKVDVQPVSGIEEAETSEIIELVSSTTRPVRKALSKDGVLDVDIIAALENSDGSQFDSADELDDEFVIVASVADEEGLSSRPVDNATTSSTGRRQEGASNQKHGPVEESDDEGFSDDDGRGDLPGRPHRERPARLLDEQFETLTLNEYDDYDDGELEDDDPFARGHADISQFSSVLSEFLDDKNTFSERYETIAESHKTPDAFGSSDSDITGRKTANTNMVVNVDVEDVVVKKTLELLDRHSEGEDLAVVEVESEEERDEWDCETVVSTFSNLDNHPAKIGAPGKSNLRPKLQDVGKTGGIIRLAGKQHLPVDYLPAKGDEDKQGGKAVRKEAVYFEKVAGPRAGETPADKKVRKAQIKEGRREARLAKKTLKLCYKNETQRAQHGAATMGPNAIHLP